VRRSVLAIFSYRTRRLRGAKKTINHRGFALASSRFGFLELMYCPCSSAGVSFPKLALSFCSRINIPVSGTPPLNCSVLTTTGPRSPGARTRRDHSRGTYSIWICDSSTRHSCSRPLRPPPRRIWQASLKDARSDRRRQLVCRKSRRSSAGPWVAS
jgi:hypothetical protein